MASVMHSKLLYAAPVWAGAIDKDKAVLGTERCSDENYLSILKYVDECCACPGERTTNELISKGKAGGLSASQGAYLC